MKNIEFLLIKLNRNPDGNGRDSDDVWLDPSEIVLIHQPNPKQKSTRLVLRNGESVTFSRWADDLIADICQKAAAAANDGAASA